MSLISKIHDIATQAKEESVAVVLHLVQPPREAVTTAECCIMTQQACLLHLD